MTLEQSLLHKKASILDKWFRLIIDTYPADTSRFLRREKDRFANPVGYTVSREIEVLYDELLHDTEVAKLSSALDGIIRVRSVQDFSPSQAIAFVFSLKKAIREELAGEIGRNIAYDDLLTFEARIDQLALLALDIYTRCRDKIYDIRLDEVRAERERALRLLEMSRLIFSQSETDPSPEAGEDQTP